MKESLGIASLELIMSQYEELLAEEAALWGKEAQRMAQEVPPDWRWHQDLRHNQIMHKENIEDLLSQVQTGMKVVELGCSSGWLTLAMAQRGADALGLDVSEVSLQIARDYYEKIKNEVKGTASYQYADLNHLQLAANTYDIIAIKGTLHHLLNMEEVIQSIHKALKPNGLLWISDSLGDEHSLAVLFASALMFVLPTHTSYKDKFSGLLKFGLNAPSRIKASMEAEGLSPFEGAGREHDWLKLIKAQFQIEQLLLPPAITGYILAQVKLKDSLAMPLLHFIKRLDVLLVSMGLLKPSGRVVFARKTD